LNLFKAVASKEDSPKGIVRFSEDVERQRRAHLNDIENIPVFMIIAFFYLLTSPNELLAINLIRIFAISRIIHTVTYAIIPTQPARAISYTVALGASMFMAIHTALYFY
jgi:glutathione S-transferase